MSVMDMRLVYKLSARLVSFLFVMSLTSVTFADDDDGDFHSSRHGNASRKPASFTSDTAKYVSLAYNGFYHRQDLAGCYNLGLAMESLKTATSLKPTQVQAVGDLLKEAKHYCAEDRVSRRQAVETIRNAVRVIHDHPVKAISGEKPEAAVDARKPAAETEPEAASVR